MNDEFFDHIKHKLAETPVPDPDQAWQQMRTLLDARGVAPRGSVVRSLSPWWQAAACVLVISASWAFYHHWASNHESLASIRAKAHRTVQGNPGRVGNASNDGSATATGGALPDGSATINGGALPDGNAAINGSTLPDGSAAINGSALPDRATPNESVPSNGNTPGGGTPSPAITSGRNAPNGASAFGAAGYNASTLSSTGTFSHPGASHAGALASTQTPFSGGITGANINTAGQALLANNAGADGGQPEDGSAASSDGASAPSKNLSLSLTDAHFLLDRPTDKPLAAGRQRAPVSASEPLHIHSPMHIPRWGFNIGLAANVPGSFRKIKTNSQKLTPGVYPMAYVQYRMTPRWNLSLGIGAPSPVSYANMPTATDLYIAADTLQNNTQTTTSQKIARLVFADIPLTVGYQVMNHLSLQAGVQLSCLLSQQDETVSVNTPLRGAFIPLALSTSALIYYPGNHDPLRANVAKIDPRGLVGVNYQLHRFSASLQYQAGLRTEISQSDADGNPINSRTSTLRMLIGYRLN